MASSQSSLYVYFIAEVDDEGNCETRELPRPCHSVLRRRAPDATCAGEVVMVCLLRSPLQALPYLLPTFYCSSSITCPLEGFECALNVTGSVRQNVADTLSATMSALVLFLI